jgi:hypothetical protein
MTSPTPSTPKIEPSLDKNFFIWGNIVLMAGTPWLLTLSMAGLAVGDSIFPDWFEISLLGLPAIALVTRLQWIQPISPFSLWFIAKPVESLSEPERRALTLIRKQSNGWYVTGWIAIAVAIFMSAVFCKIYAASALSQVIAPFPDELRFWGVLWAEIFFLLSNFLLQSGVSALRVKLTADSELGSLTPFAPEKIKDNFTHIGWRSPKFFTNDPAKITTPEPLIEKVSDVIEKKELDISDLVEIESKEIESEQLSSAEETEIEDSNLTDTTANSEISDRDPDEEIAEEVIEELNISDYKQEIAEEIQHIAIPEISSERTEVIDITSSDLENELDELIAFNLYVENILQEYLEESVEDATNNPDDTNNDGVVDITELTATSEIATAIAEEVLIDEGILEEGIPEAVTDQSTLEIPDQETDKKSPVEESQEKSKIPQEPKQSPKYLVEEFLVDKYLAKLEQLNNADKNNTDKNELGKESPEKTNTNVIEPVEPKLDEFAGLDELIDRKTINKKSVTED